MGACNRGRPEREQQRQRQPLTGDRDLERLLLDVVDKLPTGMTASVAVTKLADGTHYAIAAIHPQDGSLAIIETGTTPLQAAQSLEDRVNAGD